MRAAAVGVRAGRGARRAGAVRRRRSRLRGAAAGRAARGVARSRCAGRRRPGPVRRWRATSPRRHARADIIACLDADDAYGPDRLRAAAAGGGDARRGDGADASRSTRAAGRRAWPARAGGGDRLPIEDICELRMPFSPVYRKALCPAGVADDRVRRGRDPQRRPLLRGGHLSVRGGRGLHLSPEPELALALARRAAARPAPAICRSSTWSTRAPGRSPCEDWCGGCSRRTWPPSSGRWRRAMGRRPGGRSYVTGPRLSREHERTMPASVQEAGIANVVSAGDRLDARPAAALLPEHVGEGDQRGQDHHADDFGARHEGVPSLEPVPPRLRVASEDCCRRRSRTPPRRSARWQWRHQELSASLAA